MFQPTFGKQAISRQTAYLQSDQSGFKKTNTIFRVKEF